MTESPLGHFMKNALTDDNGDIVYWNGLYIIMMI